MPNISTGINLDSNFLNLKAIEIKEVRPEVEKLLVDNEKKCARSKQLGIKYLVMDIYYNLILNQMLI